MAVFEYKAVNDKGKRVGGIIAAEGPSSARFKLTQSRIFPLEIKEVSSEDKKARFQGFQLWFSRLKHIDPVLVSGCLRQLATLIASGIPLVDCLGTLAEQVEHAGLKRKIAQIREKVIEGSAFYQAIAEHPDVFDTVSVNMVRAAESSGGLDVILDRLADFSERSLRTRKKIASAMTYPLFLLMIAAVIMIFLMSFVMPKVVGIFRGMELALPWSTITLIWLTDFFGRWWWLIVVCAGGFLGLLGWLVRGPGERVWDRTRLRIPLLGRLHRKSVIARFTRTLGVLLRSGLPLVQSLDIAKLSLGNKVVEDAVEKATKQVEEGADFATPLKLTGYFPPLIIQLIRAGEQSGELEAMLEKAADMYEEEVNLGISSLTSLLEPVIILIMGVVVAFVVMAVLLPIFDMSAGIR
jgi:general secretion pathway protein F